MQRVIVESPFAGKGDARIAETEYNKAYLAACLYDCYKRGEAPMASHAIGPLALDDENVEHRELGIQAGFAWRLAAEKTVVYEDLGRSRGMKYGIQHAEQINCSIEFRKLGAPWGAFDAAMNRPRPTEYPKKTTECAHPKEKLGPSDLVGNWQICGDCGADLEHGL